MSSDAHHRGSGRSHAGSGSSATSDASQGFSGPLLIVGRPRSGTKLLMTLLNEHPRIAIPIAETNFMPSMIARYGDPPRLDDPGRYDDFYERFSKSVFFDWRKKFNVVLTKDELSRLADLNSWSSIFETILRYHAPKPVNEGVVWGDKSPANLPWIAQLKTIFPAGRFLHIIRDPRDLSLSARNAWGKHPYRSAEFWESEIARARLDGEKLGPDYREITYESLLADPETTLRAVCEFIGVEFVSSMLTPSVSYEELGDATGRLDVVVDNKEKFKDFLGERETRRIEEITYPTLVATGYEPLYATGHRPLRPIVRRALTVHDGVAMTLHYSRVKGVAWALDYLISQVRSRSSAALRRGA